MARQELLVSAVPLMFRVERGSDDGELRIVAEGFDAISVMPTDKIIPRPEGFGVVIERDRQQPVRMA